MLTKCSSSRQSVSPLAQFVLRRELLGAQEGSALLHNRARVLAQLPLPSRARKKRGLDEESLQPKSVRLALVVLGGIGDV